MAGILAHDRSCKQSLGAAVPAGLATPRSDLYRLRDLVGGAVRDAVEISEFMKIQPAPSFRMDEYGTASFWQYGERVLLRMSSL